MVLEHYPEMTDKHLIDLASSGSTTYKLFDSLTIYRVGTI